MKKGEPTTKKTSWHVFIANPWLPVILWASVIFALSSITQVKVSEFFFWDFALKKIAHVAEYTILYTLILRATKGNWTASYALTFFYAITDEFHQHFVPGRTANILDLGFDASGANISAYLQWKLKQARQKKHKK